MASARTSCAASHRAGRCTAPGPAPRPRGRRRPAARPICRPPPPAIEQLADISTPVRSSSSCRGCPRSRSRRPRRSRRASIRPVIHRAPPRSKNHVPRSHQGTAMSIALPARMYSSTAPPSACRIASSPIAGRSRLAFSAEPAEPTRNVVAGCSRRSSTARDLSTRRAPEAPRRRPGRPLFMNTTDGPECRT